MINKEANASNKKKAGSGNGNTVIDNKNTTENVINYVSGDVPSSSGHTFDENNQSKSNDKR